ncbi:UDP-N-acetylhexosamine pyrophosphorylase-like [Tropilaelaps mercedesae]|uniref:UDP-N-acetylglucosamine diphosphorylase n=1 Tax=Tropilaelaps mercedesae TaxID=418985 RepID=A0A1V9XX78_9ACAR|nr:UDP-N-acetylhexosamine pyrophosphorylase-like [Tropilaelaps mercedesae]
MTECQLKQVQALLAEYDQEHLLQFWDRLDEKQRSELIDCRLSSKKVLKFLSIFVLLNKTDCRSVGRVLECGGEGRIRLAILLRRTTRVRFDQTPPSDYSRAMFPCLVWHFPTDHSLSGADIEYVDVARCAAAFSNVMLPGKATDNLDLLLEPVSADQFGSVARSTPEQLATYRRAGLEAVSRGEVAALLLAGGQGTRLGVPYPKGMYDVGLPSGKTLYQLQGERLKRLEHLVQQQTGCSGCSIPWYIMTSEHTKEPTLEFFAKHGFFGLNQDNFVVFEQNMMPSFGFDGKIILEKPHRLALSPDGNGGLYNVLYKRGILDDMARRGIKYIHAYCVDNILVKIADPTFIGFCISKNADCAAKHGHLPPIKETWRSGSYE